MYEVRDLNYPTEEGHFTTTSLAIQGECWSENPSAALYTLSRLGFPTGALRQCVQVPSYSVSVSIVTDYVLPGNVYEASMMDSDMEWYDNVFPSNV